MKQRLIQPTVGLIVATLFATQLLGDGLRDNDPTNVRRIPRPGIDVPSADRQMLESRLKELAVAIGKLRARNDQQTAELLPDILIFHRAVDTALAHNEFFSKGDLTKAKRLLAVGQLRAEQLLAGDAPWTRQTGLVVRGYLSKIDHTVQPYGLVIPESYAGGSKRVRLDLWFHGRGETLSEVNFIDQRMRQVGQYAPTDTIVLHPYGRYSNAFKFAGETDVLEALADVQRRYRIDSDRIAARGFSMGGAACWQFAVHYADRWFAANPGAGFAETPEFLKFFQKETLSPTWYERKLWHLYDCTDYAANLLQCPTVAYSGELDIQKQAADIMAKALAREGIDLVHIIGPNTRHAIHPAAKLEIERRLATLAAQGRRRTPRRVRFVTYTLKYNRMNWITIHALGEHWSRAEVDAVVHANRIELHTENVTDLSIRFGPGEFPESLFVVPDLVLNKETTIPGRSLPRLRSDRSWECRLHLEDDQWVVGAPPRSIQTLVKRHDLQGPIDDAFMDSFIFVRPTGAAQHAAVDHWTRGELTHAVEHWRRHFRGDARVKDDLSVTDEDIASANLVLFGDPTSNALLARLADRLPIRWTKDEITVGDRRFDAARHALVLVYPNPLNPQRYVVLNSGFTYREYDYLNNARQVPKLPDWAVIDLTTPPDSRRPGRIAAADFFDERWQLRPHSAH